MVVPSRSKLRILESGPEGSLLISILDEVLGPRGHGSSSSHTGAPHRASFQAHEILGGPPQRARVIFLNSFATTYGGHHTDIAIAAGLRGVNPEIESQEFKAALQLARAAGMGITFEAAGNDASEHDNTIVMHLERGLNRLEIKVISTGGGRFQVPVCKLNDVEYPFLSEPVPGSLEEAEKEIKKARTILDLASKVSANHFFSYNGLARDMQVDLAQFALLYETYIQIKKGGLKTTKEVLAKAEFILDVMMNAVEQGMRHRQQTSFTDGNWANAMTKRLWHSGSIKHAFVGAIAAQEYNAGMGFVAFAPTGGASGTLPGTLYYFKKVLRIPKKQLVNALLVAGLAGQVAFLRGAVSGAQVGCGGEIGVAAVMSAVGAAYLLGGNFKEMDVAAALAGQSYIGLDCSPARALVEYPCIPRNGFAAVNAVLAAETAISINGINSADPDSQVYGLDGTLTRIFAVGSRLPASLRERESGDMTETFLRENCCGKGGCTGCSRD